MHYILRIMNYALRILHYALHMTHYALCITYCASRIPIFHSTFCIPHSTLCIMHCICFYMSFVSLSQLHKITRAAFGGKFSLLHTICLRAEHTSQIRKYPNMYPTFAYLYIVFFVTHDGWASTSGICFGAHSLEQTIHTSTQF